MIFDRARLPFSGGLLFVIVAACSGSTAGVNVDPDQASNDAASAFCTRANTCAPAFVELEWGDPATCTAKEKGKLSGTLAAAGTSLTPSQYESCAQALANASCDDVLGRNLPDACKAQPGTLANGAACGDNSQCTGGHCNIASGQACGVCSAFAQAGAACAIDDDCGYGLTCQGKICVAYLTAGGACSTDHPCTPTLVCKNASCTTPDAAGTPCTPTKDTCDNLHGVYCSVKTSTCTSATFVMAGAACGFLPNGISLCQGGGGSVIAECKGLTGTLTTGTCQASAADGAACNDTTGPFCVVPSLCVNGACKLNDPSTCR